MQRRLILAGQLLLVLVLVLLRLDLLLQRRLILAGQLLLVLVLVLLLLGLAVIQPGLLHILGLVDISAIPARGLQEVCETQMANVVNGLGHRRRTTRLRLGLPGQLGHAGAELSSIGQGQLDIAIKALGAHEAPKICQEQRRKKPGILRRMPGKFCQEHFSQNPGTPESKARHASICQEPAV